MYRPTIHKKYVTILTVAVKDFEYEQHFCYPYSLGRL